MAARSAELQGLSSLSQTVARKHRTRGETFRVKGSENYIESSLSVSNSLGICRPINFSFSDSARNVPINA
jgi:hypothetical protein